MVFTLCTVASADSFPAMERFHIDFSAFGKVEILKQVVLNLHCDDENDLAMS